MADIVLATDADWVADEVTAALAGALDHVHRLRTGAEVRPWVTEHAPDLILLDLQIGNMGGMAACLELHHDMQAGTIPKAPVLMLLDRGADVFLARRSEADGWLVKPLDSFRLRRAAQALLSGQQYHEETSTTV